VFRRYFLNQWTATEDAWIPYGVWDECRSEIELDPGLPLYVGIDIAIYVDSTAVSLVQKHVFPPVEHDDDPEVRYVVRSRIWENPYPPEHALHDQWRMNNNEVMEYLRDLREQYPAHACEIDGAAMAGPMYAYDPYHFRPEAEALAGEGLAMVEFPQFDSRMVPASQAFYEAIMKGEIAHDGDPALKRQVHTVTADQKPRGWRMSKPKGSKRKIDAAIATGIAVYVAKTTTPPSERRSVYEDGPLIVVG
jgi:phage terminase large subunit-like protein